MSSGDRVFDPDEVALFRTTIEMQLEYLEEDIIIHLKEGGTLSYAPAFGLADEAGRAGDYSESFTNIWQDLQNYKATLKGLIKTLDQTLEGEQFSEEENVRDLKILDLDGNSAGPGGTNWDGPLPQQ
ncbi:hypothetical protein [Natronoglycomyces albus]|uniref:Uncharacterized protein n=1 Tax=Natronoglycomyces albus TaxID=2811108 RepID=A0A895XTH8_9ACTN|nr:hypothetical protein [Natronoglycomyces albus]QSB05836.1 hypothetical protein JQS30_02605 [Natronoglycomyces albus]